MIPESLKQIAWSGVEKFASSGIHFLFTLLLARQLFPEDYAVIAVLGVFMAVSQAFIDNGFGSALIQSKKNSELDYCSVFCFNVTFSLFFYLVLFISAPWIADFFKNEQLIDVVRVYSLVLVISSLRLVHGNLITKNLDFAKFAKTSIVSSLVSGIIALVLAYQEWGYWALVAQALISNFLTTILYWKYSNWSPSLRFSFKSLRRLLPYSANILGTSVISAVYNNLYSIVIGRAYTAQDLGLYNRAYSLNFFLPQSISDFVMKAMFPIQSRIQDDKVMLAKQNYMTMHTIMFILLPCSAFILFNTEDVIRILLSDKWIEIVPFAKVLSISCLSYVLSNIYLNILKVSGKAKYVLYSEVTKKVIGISVLLVTMHFGIMVMVYGMLIYAALEVIVGTFFVNKVLYFPLWNQLKNISLIIVVAYLSMWFCSVLFTGIPYLLLRVCLSGIAGSVIYFVILLISKDETVMYLKNMLKAK